MQRIVFMLLDAAFSGLILLPVFYFLNQKYFHSVRKSVWYFALAVYLSGMYAVVGLPDIRYIRLDLHINLTPFAYMFSDYRSTSLNVLLFLPLGFFLPVLWTSFRGLLPTAAMGLGLSLIIELMQIFTLRATDVNDLMTNTTGTILGWCIGRICMKCLPGLLPGEDTQEFFALWAISFGVMFFLQPYLADAIIFLF